MDLHDIIYEKHESIATARINRPARLNAFRQTTYEELLAVLDDCGNDERVRVLVIAGTGRAFSAGDDLKELDVMLSSNDPVTSMDRTLTVLQEITRRIVSLPKIVIAAVNGIAVGFGVELALAADIRVAAEVASFEFAEARRGLFVTNGAIYLLPRLVGLGRAMHLMITGCSISASEALECGLVSSVFPMPAFMPGALQIAHAISRNAPTSVRLLKPHLRASYELDLEEAMRLEVAAVRECAKNGETAEGARAFLERRSPSYDAKRSA